MIFNLKLSVKRVAWCVALVAVALLQMHFVGGSTTNQPVKQYVDTSLEQLATEIATLCQVAEAYKSGNIGVDSIQKQLVATRTAYKRVESITTYYFPEHDKYYINGAPLQHLDPYPIGKEYKDESYYAVSAKDYANTLPLDKMEAGHYLDETATVIDPVGLQRLDEIIFTDEVYTEQERIVTLSKELLFKYLVLKNELLKRKYYLDFEVFEFTRLELIRIMSKGITGFDTPGSLNAMQEAAAAIQGVQTILQSYIVKVPTEQQANLQGLFTNAVLYLQKHQDFEKFDRLVFIKEYLNPLYAATWHLQKQLQIETVAAKYNQTPSWNASTTNFFDTNFLNPYYYSILKERDDSPELRALGKALFYNKQLSKGGNLSCASCHSPDKGYADGEKTSLAGIPGERVQRNAPTLINAVFSDRYFYDLRAFDLEDQAAHVIENHMEFNTSFKEIVAKLNANSTYKANFNAVFNSKQITRYQFSAALASYVISLRSFDSDFDKFMRGETNHISAKVKKGFNLFMGKANCATCHYAPTFSGLVPPLYNENESEVLGVLAAPNVMKIDEDAGRRGNEVNNEKHDIYKNSFKTVTVRNAALTAPYFHNGAYGTLDEVLDFYNKGGGAGMGLAYEVPNQTLSPDALGLSKAEIAALKAFINSLTNVPAN